MLSIRQNFLGGNKSKNKNCLWLAFQVSKKNFKILFPLGIFNLFKNILKVMISYRMLSMHRHFLPLAQHGLFYCTFFSAQSACVKTTVPLYVMMNYF
jgi:hypothetical protein